MVTDDAGKVLGKHHHDALYPLQEGFPGLMIRTLIKQPIQPPLQNLLRSYIERNFGTKLNSYFRSGEIPWSGSGRVTLMDIL